MNFNERSCLPCTFATSSFSIFNGLWHCSVLSCLLVLLLLRAELKRRMQPDNKSLPVLAK